LPPQLPAKPANSPSPAVASEAANLAEGILFLESAVLISLLSGMMFSSSGKFDYTHLHLQGISHHRPRMSRRWLASKLTPGVQIPLPAMRKFLFYE
jgi:hypothetical protein